MKNEIGKLEYNLEEPHSKKAFRRASSADDAYIALHQIANEVFRPARKHGYADEEIAEMISKSGTFKDKNGWDVNTSTEVIGLLEQMFYKILEEHQVDLDDLE